jgi:hypothetical protein
MSDLPPGRSAHYPRSAPANDDRAWKAAGGEEIVEVPRIAACTL